MGKWEGRGGRGGEELKYSVSCFLLINFFCLVFFTVFRSG